MGPFSAASSRRPGSSPPTPPHADAPQRDERFIRMWDYYLAYCEGGFEERHISDVQILLAKTHNRRVLYGEPRFANRVGQAELFEEIV
jgi:hypothetical protein